MPPWQGWRAEKAAVSESPSRAGLDWSRWLRERCAALLGLVLTLFLVGCGTEAWERDPAVQAAKQACTGLGEGDTYDCVEHRAVESLNPDLCRLAGKWIDDMCLQAVYEAAGDPAICEQLYLQGVRPTCHAYYAARLAPLQTPLPPEPLPAFLVEVFPEPAAVLSLDEYSGPGWRPGRPGAQEVPSSVCVEVDTSALLARGDVWEAADVQNRTTVYVDGGRVYSGGRQELITAFVDHMLLHTLMDPAGDPSGTVVASVGGPYHLCVHAPLPAGVHRVVDGHPEQRGIWVFGLDVGQARRLFVWEEGEWATVEGPWFEPGQSSVEEPVP